MVIAGITTHQCRLGGRPLVISTLHDKSTQPASWLQAYGVSLVKNRSVASQQRQTRKSMNKELARTVLFTVVNAPPLIRSVWKLKGLVVGTEEGDLYGGICNEYRDRNVGTGRGARKARFTGPLPNSPPRATSASYEGAACPGIPEYRGRGGFKDSLSAYERVVAYGRWLLDAGAELIRGQDPGRLIAAVQPFGHQAL